MRLNRQLQLRILEFLRESFPNPAQHFFQQEFSANRDFPANVRYLFMHGLITGKETWSRDTYGMVNASITEKGLDFLEDDGGVSAILRTVTIKFDPENVRTLLQDKIVASALSQERKQTLMERIRSLPAEGLKTLLDKIIGRALDNPDIWETIAGILGSGGGPQPTGIIA